MSAIVTPHGSGTIQFWDIVGSSSSFTFVPLGARVPVSTITGGALTVSTLQPRTFAVVAQYFPADPNAFMGSYSQNVYVSLVTLGSPRSGQGRPAVCACRWSPASRLSTWLLYSSSSGRRHCPIDRMPATSGRLLRVSRTQPSRFRRRVAIPLPTEATKETTSRLSEIAFQTPAP